MLSEYYYHYCNYLYKHKQATADVIVESIDFINKMRSS